MSEVKIPPIKIQGIKSKLIPFIKENLPDLTDKTWYEPFLGSGVVGLNLSPNKAVFGDSNPYTIKLYQDIQNKDITPKNVKEFLEEEGKKLAEKDDEYFYEVRERFNKKHKSLDFIFLNRTDFNGMIRFNKNGGFNVPYGHKKDRFSQAYITKIVNQIKWVSDKIDKNDWRFVCMDCFDFLKKLAEKDENAFIYLDPPYIGRNVDYYDSWDEDSEIKLQQILHKIQKPFLLSTWSHDDYRKNLYIEKIWKDYKIATTEHKYFVAANADSRRKVVEAVLKNY